MAILTAIRSTVVHRKVKAATLASAVVGVLVAALKSGGVEVPTDVAAAATTVLTFAAGFATES